MSWDIYEPWDRCELDHRDGRVCLRRLNWDGTCPGEDEHCPDDGSEHPHDGPHQ